MNRIVTIAFIALTLLSLFWPDPVIWLNERSFDLPLGVDRHDSFEREPLRWDIPIWFAYGLIFLVLVSSKGFSARNAFEVFRAGLPESKIRKEPIPLIAASGVAIAIPLMTMALLDAPLVSWLSSTPEAVTEPLTRPVNRLAGGSTPTLIALFLLFAGVSWRRVDLFRQGIGIAIVTLMSSVPMSLAKRMLGRVRPEAWEGPFRFFGEGESFPSGHTLSAFVLASVACFSGNPIWVRVGALILASIVAISRVLTFRHWPSDVVASAALALLAGWLISPMLRDEKQSGEEAGMLVESDHALDLSGRAADHGHGVRE